MRLRRRERIVTKRITVPDWRSEKYDSLHKSITDEAEKHQPRQNGAHLSDDSFGQTWWCTVCHTRWPCRFLRWGRKALGNDNVMLPLRSPIAGEQIDGDGVRLGSGSWMRVEGHHPDGPSAKTAARVKAERAAAQAEGDDE